MIHEIVIQTADPTRREEYIREFGETLIQANFPVLMDLECFPALKIQAGSSSSLNGTASKHMRSITAHPPTTRCARSPLKYETAKSDGAHFSQEWQELLKLRREEALAMATGWRCRDRSMPVNGFWVGEGFTRPRLPQRADPIV